MKTLLTICLTFLSLMNAFAQTESEPNDNRSEADLITVTNGTAAVTGLIGETRDEDFYLVNLPQGIILDVTIINNDPDLGLIFEVQDQTGQTLYDRTASEGNPLFAVLPICEANTYYLKVKARTNSQSSDVPYQLNITLNRDDAYECNDLRSDATSMSFDQDYNITIFPARDVDYFKITVPRSGVLSVFVTENHVDLRLNVEIQDATGMKVKDAGIILGTPLNFPVQICEAGTYYIKVSEQNTSGQHRTPFKIRANFNTADECECNESLNDACSILPNSSFRGASFPNRDIDWYTFDISEAGFLQVAITDLPYDMNMKITLKDDQNEQLKRVIGGDGENVKLFYPICTAGTYYLEIDETTANRPHWGPDTYAVQVEFQNDDAYECDNTTASATDIGYCDTLTARAFPDDQDLFRFEASISDTIFLNAIAEDPILPEINVYDSLGFRRITIAADTEKEAKGWFVATYTGIYFAGVKSASQSIGQNRYDFVIYSDMDPCRRVTSTSSLAVASFNLFPNPATDVLFVEGLNGGQSYAVFDIYGNKVLTDFTDGRIDVQDLVSGIYIIRFDTEEGLISQKFIKR